ncbi:glycosyltransferase family 1 protein [Clostridium sediminicola]|uniref:glycosyltransferase family 4 protein n=1 Tax=Clostridium sediminicola TaxID=3114879 RepID=UPI0031F21DE9
MKIGIDGRAAYWYRGTGIGTYTYELIYSLSKFNKEEFIIYSPKDTIAKCYKNSNLKYKYINQYSKNIFWEDVNNPIYINNDVSIFHTPQNGIGSPFKEDCKNIITLHDIIPSRMPETVSDCYMNIYRKEMPRILEKTNGIITVSQFSKNDIIKEFNFPKEKIFVTHLANEHIYKRLDTKKCKSILKNEYSILGNYILYVGGFSPRKNILGLINAYSMYIAQCPNSNTKLLIVGHKGKSYSIYKQRVEKLHLSDKVIFTGYIPVKHMPIFYNAAKVLVYPSFYEGFGLPPLEAMSCGIPIVSSNVTSIPEIIGDAAHYINPYNTDELFLAIKEVLNNNELRNKLVKRGFEKCKEYTWKKTAQKTLDAYKSLCT